MKTFLPALLLALPAMTTSLSAQVVINEINSSYSENFNSLASSGASNPITTLPSGWVFIETGTNANDNYAAGTGSSNAGNTYSFGIDASDRALGALQSGSLNPLIGVSFTNHSGTTITSILIEYKGEQWRMGAANRGADRLDFQYSLDATSHTSGTWIDLNEFDFSSPVTTGTVGALNGNDSINSTPLSSTITDIQLAEGETLYLRWLDFNVSNADDGLAIDDFTITAYGMPATGPSITFQPSNLDFGDVPINDGVTMTYEVGSNNLTDSITISTTSAYFSIASDTNAYSNHITLAPSGGMVYVHFSPTAPGMFMDTIVHTSDSIRALFIIKGNGFDPSSNIISIAAARRMSVGEIVTVAGRITVADELGSPSYVQDASGGIPVFDFNFSNSITIGDSVIVTGPIGVFNDQVQISGSGISFIVADTIPRVITPTPIAITQMSAYEGMLVTVQDVTLVNPSFVFYPQSTERIRNNGVEVDLRIDGDTDIAGLTKPQDTVDITGVVGRFRNNAQLLPRFSNDIPGVREPSTPADSIPKSLTFDVVNWNVEFFGAKSEDYGNEEFGPEDELLQLQNIRLVLDSVQADIIAVQEVSDEAFFMDLTAQLDGYNALCSQRYSYSFENSDDDFPPQKVCFIYDTATVTVLSDRVMFEGLYDSARLYDPSLLPAYPTGNASSFYSSGRLPYLLNVKVNINGSDEIVSLINIHGKSGAASADWDRRAYDAMVLKDTLDQHFANKQVIILGDLNDDLDSSITSGRPSPYDMFVNDGNYYPITKPLSDAGARSTVGFMDVIDHQIISTALFESYLDESAQVITPFRYISNYANSTSDHLPVLSRFVLPKILATFRSESLTITEQGATYEIEVSLDKTAKNDMPITIALQGNATYGIDYQTQPAADSNVLHIVIPAGSTSASILMTVFDDAIDELEEDALFILSNGDIFKLTIEDDDVPSIGFEKIFYSVKEGAAAYDITLPLSSPPVADETISIKVYNGPGVHYGDDYETSPGLSNDKIELLVPAGSESVHISFSAIADNKRELPVEALTFFLDKASDGLRVAHQRVSVLSIIDVAKRKPHFILFPNPTTGIIKLMCEQLDDNEVLYAEARNYHDRVIFSGRGTMHEISSDMSAAFQEANRGIYTVKLFIDNEAFTIRLLKI